MVHQDRSGHGTDADHRAQKRAYTLSDRGTFLATKNLDSKILVQGGQQLQNPYHVIVVKHAGTNVGCAQGVLALDHQRAHPDA